MSGETGTRDGFKKMINRIRQKLRRLLICLVNLCVRLGIIKESQPND